MAAAMPTRMAFSAALSTTAVKCAGSSLPIRFICWPRNTRKPCRQRAMFKVSDRLAQLNPVGLGHGLRRKTSIGAVPKGAKLIIGHSPADVSMSLIYASRRPKGEGGTR